MQADIERYGKDDTLFIMDREFCSGANVHWILNYGRRFVMPTKTIVRFIIRLLTLFGITTEKETLVYNKHVYIV